MGRFDLCVMYVSVCGLAATAWATSYVPIDSGFISIAMEDGGRCIGRTPKWRGNRPISARLETRAGDSPVSVSLSPTSRRQSPGRNLRQGR